MTDAAEDALQLPALMPIGGYRWCIFDLPSRTFFLGGPDVTTHMTVAERSGLLRQSPAYYRPGPQQRMFGGFIIRVAVGRSRSNASADDVGAFAYDPFSGTFPPWQDHVLLAEQALQEICAENGWPFTRIT